MGRQGKRVFPRGLRLEPPKVDKAILALVYDALLENRRFMATYRMRGEKGARKFEVNPVALVVRGSLLTLVCTIGNSDAPRQLHLHRMRDARATTRIRRTPPPALTWTRTFAKGNLSFCSVRELRIRALFARDRWADVGGDAPLERPEAQKGARRSSFLEATLPDTLELRAWLASYGPHVEVLEPAALREQIGLQARETPRSTRRRTREGPRTSCASDARRERHAEC